MSETKKTAKSTKAEPKTTAKEKAADAPAKDAAAPEKGATDSAAKDPAKGYARGENQKPVSPQYRKNWDAIFGGKK